MGLLTESLFRLTLEELQRQTILLATDRRLPSVTTLVAGEPVRGSWWGHPSAHAIFQVLEQLAVHRDVAVTKLVSGKVTYVHRILWSALIGVGSAREPWQLDGLTPAAGSLLGLIATDGSLRTDRLPPSSGIDPKAAGEAIRELERNLLICSQQIHTSRGAHAKLLESWERWASRVGFVEERLKPSEGRRKLEEALLNLNRRYGGRGRLPWQRPS